MPVSSSKVVNITPFVLPGRWQTTTCYLNVFREEYHLRLSRLFLSITSRIPYA